MAVDPRVAVADVAILFAVLDKLFRDEVAILFAVLDKLFRDEVAEEIALLKLFSREFKDKQEPPEPTSLSIGAMRGGLAYRMFPGLAIRFHTRRLPTRTDCATVPTGG